MFIPAVRFFTHLEWRVSPKTLASQIISSQNSWPLLKTFFYGGFISPFPRFLPSSPCIPYLSALLFTLHFPLLSLPSPTMASTLHMATAFWLLLPCDFLPFVSTLRSLIYASQEGQTHLLDTHFISCCWKTITDLLH